MNLTRNLESQARLASLFLMLAALLTLGLPAARAQQEEEQKGIDQGNYNIKQSIEFGGRFTSVGGDFQTYDTFVNLQQGPRLLGFTLEMNSLDHHGTLFDHFYFNNFGYGGDPNMESRLRISKNKWYNFDAMFRKDENFWDYSLQANPYNPTTPFVNGPVGYGGAACISCVQTTSPHLMNTRRKLGDYNLLLLPQSRVRFRLGYSRNTVDGPGYSTIHQGTEQALYDDFSSTVDTYRMGADFKLLPRTSISFDEILSYYKGDTGATDPFANPLFALSNGTPVDLGVSLNAGAGQPCGNTFGGPPAGAVNPACSAYFSYLSHGRIRTNTATEQVSLQSNYWKDWEFSARASYSAGDMNVYDYNQSVFGRESRTNLRNDLLTGPMQGRRVAATADFGVTYHITPKLDFLDTFHFENWHDPAQFLSSDCSFFSPNLLTPANVFSPTASLPLNCAPPTASVAGTPVHNTSSGPDVALLLNANFLKQDEKTNVAEFEYQFNPKLGARVGYRFRHRAIADNFYNTTDEIYFPSVAARGSCALVGGVLPAGCTQNGDGSISYLVPAGPPDPAGQIFINENAALFGLWARPTANWRVSLDTEITSADNVFTRISPRQSQEYRIRSKYKVNNWLNLNGNVNIWEGRNNVSTVNDLQHDRSYGVSAIFQPLEKLGFEVGYDYDDIYSQVLICFLSTTTIGTTVVQNPGIGPCPNVPPSPPLTGPQLVQQVSTYTNTSNYGYFNLTFTPVKRLTARLGADLTGTSGSQLSLDPQAPFPNQVTGPLNSKWLHPFGGLDYQFARNWTGKFFWDYYGYHEDPTAGAVIDIYGPRNFRANLVTLSVRYAF